MNCSAEVRIPGSIQYNFCVATSMLNDCKNAGAGNQLNAPRWQPPVGTKTLAAELRDTRPSNARQKGVVTAGNANLTGARLLGYGKIWRSTKLSEL